MRITTRQALQRCATLALLPLLLALVYPAGAARAFHDPSGAPASTLTQSEWTPPPLSLMLTEPLPPFQGSHITAIHQEGCGDPSRALVFVQVADPDQIATVRYEYHVGTTVPFDGVNNSPTMAGGARLWRGMIGPFEADPRNADGGPITVTAYGLYRDGSERSVTQTWTLRPCVR